MIMEKHYYLINGKIMKGGEMPNVMYNHPNYNDIMMTWKNSLQPCEISESELIKIRSEIADLLTDNPIEITDIVRVKEIRTETKSGGWTDYKIYFKQPKAKEDSEAMEKDNWNNWIKREDLNKWHKVDHDNFIKPPSSTNIIFYTKALSVFCGHYKSSQGFVCYGISKEELTDVEVTHWRLLDHPKEVQEMLDGMDKNTQ